MSYLIPNIIGINYKCDFSNTLKYRHYNRYFCSKYNITTNQLITNAEIHNNTKEQYLIFEKIEKTKGYISLK